MYEHFPRSQLVDNYEESSARALSPLRRPT